MAFHYTHIWQKSETLIIPNAGKDVEQQQLPSITDGNACGYPATFEDSLSVSYKIKHTLAI